MNFKAILTSAFFFTVPEKKKKSSLSYSDVLNAERRVYFKTSLQYLLILIANEQ